jgi:hypothetical protein
MLTPLSFRRIQFAGTQGLAGSGSAQGAREGEEGGRVMLGVLPQFWVGGDSCGTVRRFAPEDF